MIEVYTTSADILFLVLTIVIGFLGLFLIIAVYHVIHILRNVNKVTGKARDTMDLINHYLWQPIKIAMMAFEKMKDRNSK